MSNWIVNVVLALVAERDAATLPLNGSDLAELLGLVEAATISGTVAKAILARVIRGEGSPRALLERDPMIQLDDASVLGPAVDRVLAANPETVERYRTGKTNVLGFLVGCVMKETGGKASPKGVDALLRAKVSA